MHGAGGGGNATYLGGAGGCIVHVVVPRDLLVSVMHRETEIACVQASPNGGSCDNVHEASYVSTQVLTYFIFTYLETERPATEAGRPARIHKGSPRKTSVHVRTCED